LGRDARGDGTAEGERGGEDDGAERAASRDLQGISFDSIVARLDDMADTSRF